MSVDLDAPRFLLSDVARAARMNIDSLRAWVKRGNIRLSETDAVAPKSGTANRVSLRTALGIVGAAEISAVLKTEIACRIAQDWANDL